MRTLKNPALWLALIVSGAALAAQDTAPGYTARAAAVVSAKAGAPLATKANGAPPQAVAAALQNRGRSAAVLASLSAGTSNAGRNGMSHWKFEQSVEGLSVYGAYVKAAFNRSGDLVHLIDHLANVPAGNMAPASVAAVQALKNAMVQLHPEVQVEFRGMPGNGNTQVFDGGDFFHESPTVMAVAVPLSDGSMARGWLVETWAQASNQLHHTLVGGDGRILNIESRTSNDQYKVFVEDPLKAAQQVVTGPGGGNAQSPAGWLGTGAQTTINISGNNVNAYLDADKNNRADKGGSPVATGEFLTAVDLIQSPTTATNKAVAVQNLFYLNNVIHDILYAHGFVEAAGNFQIDNFGNGGAGKDPVLAEAQDGSGTDNANFSTPTDGRKPRMQMYLWTGAGPTHELKINSPTTTGYGGNGAEFGPAFTVAGITGAAVNTVPADGCTAISTALAGKIALIDRGTCDFSLKALNAQKAGASAVVVVNNVGNTTYFTMGAGANAKQVRIPAMMISQGDGALVRALTSPNATAHKLALQPLQLDASLDSDIVFHEFGHGLTWRMIGGMSGPIGGALGEGTSDVVAFLVNGDDRIGEYSAHDPNGIRRAPYSGYPLTYADVDGTEVHNDGEIFAAIMWRITELLPGRNSDILTYLVDSMNFTPATPTFETMRDGIISSVKAGPSAPGDLCAVWTAFAQFGIGDGSSATINSSTSVTTTTSFAKGDGCP